MTVANGCVFVVMVSFIFVCGFQYDLLCSVRVVENTDILCLHPNKKSWNFLLEGKWGLNPLFSILSKKYRQVTVFDGKFVTFREVELSNRFS